MNIIGDSFLSQTAMATSVMTVPLKPSSALLHFRKNRFFKPASFRTMAIGNQELPCTYEDGAPLTTRGDDEGDLSCPTYFVTGIHLGLGSVRMAPRQLAGMTDRGLFLPHHAKHTQNLMADNKAIV
jgi:hypothetical protein